MAEHTPGPWRVITRFGNNVIEIDTDDAPTKSLRVATAWGETPDILDPVFPSVPEAHANARLIAASPEMRELLIIVRDRLNRWYTHGNRDPEDIIAIWDEIVTSMSRMEVL